MGLIYAEIISAGDKTPFVAENGGTPSLDPTWHQGYLKVGSCGKVVSRKFNRYSRTSMEIIAELCLAADRQSVAA